MKNKIVIDDKRGLFGVMHNGRLVQGCVMESAPRARRRVREGSDASDQAKEHLIQAVAQHHRDGDHDKAMELSKQIEEMYGDDKDIAEDDESLDDESQAGRGEPTKGKGEENDTRDDKGKENMESRRRRRSGRALLESDRRRDAQREYWVGRLLRG